MADLRDHAVFLSASFPSADDRGRRFEPFDAAAAADAVTAVARAVLMSNGRLVFGAHPTISPLVLLVAAETAGAGSVEVYQSCWFEDVIPVETRTLIEAGHGVLHWVDAAETRPASLAALRQQMLSRPDLIAGVFVGGMEGIRDEFAALGALRDDVVRVPVPGPGGAARELPVDRELEERLGISLRSGRYTVLALDLVDFLHETRTSG